MSASVAVKRPLRVWELQDPLMISLPYGNRQTDTYMQASANFVYYSDRVKIIPEYLVKSHSQSEFPCVPC
jgi:hypothetical protein